MLDHFSYFSWSYILFELLCTGHQVFGRNKSFVIFINIAKYSLYIILSVLIARVSCHQLNKLFETDLTSFVSIKVRHSDVNETPGWVESSILFDGFPEIKWSQHSVMIVIQVIEYLLEHLYILLSCIGCNKLFWIKVNISLGISEAALHFFLRSSPSILTKPEGSLTSAIFT